ncbi:MAG: putative lipid II flippase FtsW [SAR324 cluster bacterium]|nr:putative lipid II flippase FtsW [SAR324 cluster bacterium]
MPVLSKFRFLQIKPSLFLLFNILALISIGIVIIYSSSAFYAERDFGSPYFFIVRQLIALGIGTILLRIAIKFPYENYKKLTPILMIITLVLMLIVLIPGIGRQVGNARRWIRFFGIGFQPSEILKLTLIIWVAGFLDRKKELLGYFSRGMLPSFIVTGIFCFLLLLQPDFGTAVLICITLLLMIFAAGVKTFHMVGSLAGIVTIGSFLIFSKAYRMRRVTGFLDPWADPLDSGFQLVQSFIAFGTGGIFGRNLGNSRQKLFFLPEGHTDFIFAILAEETGFIGMLIVLVLVALLMLKGFEISQNCPDDFGRNLAFGITSLIFLQTIFHVGVVIGLLPTKGIPLPFISYGGTSLVMCMFMVGILINISNSSYSVHSDGSKR